MREPNRIGTVLVGLLLGGLAACGGDGVDLEKECKKEGAQCVQLRFTWEVRTEDGDAIDCAGGTVGVQLSRVGKDDVVEFTAPCGAGEMLTTKLPSEGYDMVAMLWDAGGGVITSRTGTTPTPPRDVHLEFVIPDGPPPPPPPPPVQGLGKRCSAATPCTDQGYHCIELFDVGYGYCSPICGTAPAGGPDPGEGGLLCRGALVQGSEDLHAQCSIPGGSSGTVPYACVIFCEPGEMCPNGLVCRSQETGEPIDEFDSGGICG